MKKYSGNCYKEIKVCVIICIHNALSDLKRCLNSFIDNSKINFEIIFVNDGSSEETTKYIDSFIHRNNVFVIHNKTPLGYTRAANQGIRKTNADAIILLNSDTIVPSGWDAKLITCLKSSPKIGLAGPLSNAASWQSIPYVVDDSGLFAINRLPPGYEVDDMDTLLTRISQTKYPRVGLLNGFCLAIKREVIDAIGVFDEIGFPFGFGEENDYCLRALQAGFELAIADNLYVYHAKSKSYGHETRTALSREGHIRLIEKHGEHLVNSTINDIKKNNYLEKLREKFRTFLDYNANSLSTKQQNTHGAKCKINNYLKRNIKITYLLPCVAGGGGQHSVVQEACGLENIGCETKIAILRNFFDGYAKHYSTIKNFQEIFQIFDDERQMIEKIRNVDIVVATTFDSVYILKKIVENNIFIKPAYYIQDYEPFFQNQDSESYKLAINSYTAVENCILFAKTRWLCNFVSKIHNVVVNKVKPSLDTSIYYNPTINKVDEEIIKICAMIRPSTPRRNPESTMNVLKSIKSKYGNSIEIHTFGCSEKDIKQINICNDFLYSNHGRLTRQKVADLLRRSDIFVDFSTYQAFGRTALEAMACGCAVIVPKHGGTDEYAVDKFNALVIDTHDENNCFNALDMLIYDMKLRENIKKNALIKSSEYSIEKACKSILDLFMSNLHVENCSKENIAVSIVIPVFNNLDLTKKCLGHVFKYSPLHCVELIIINNKSSDGTKSFFNNLGFLPFIHVIHNNENLGFARACNQGAKAASGDYLVFLNNDTVPQPGWLESLMNFAVSHQKAGIVGSKLLYPDGTIQHCGASMNHNGTYFRHQYKFLPHDHTLVNSIRELDAVTAACFMTPRKLFYELGMFDENYLNGCEDMDYCTKVRNAGYKIFYNPESVLYHLESQTPRPANKDKQNFGYYLSKWGTGRMKNEIEIYAEDGFWVASEGVFKKSDCPHLQDFMKAIKTARKDKDKQTLDKYSEIIRRIYPVDVWSKDSLSPPQASAISNTFQSPSSVLKTLFVCHNFPPYNTAGAQLFALNLARELKSLGHNVSFFYPVDISKRGPGEDKTPYAVVTTEYEGLKVHQINVVDGSANLFENPQYMFANESVEQQFEELLRREQFDLVHFHLLYRLSARLPLIAKSLNIPAAATLHDYWLLCAMGHLIDTKGRECSGPESPEKCARCLEGFQADPAAEIVEFFRLRQQINQTGYEALDRKYSPSKHLADVHARYGFPRPAVLPLGWPAVKAHRSSPTQNDRIVLGFIGQIVYRKGLDLLVKAVNALDTTLRDKCELHIHGAVHQPQFFDAVMETVKDNPGVKFFGPYKQDELGSVLSSFDVAVIPSRQENYPLTVLESLSAKVPVIASDVGGVREMFQDKVEGFLFPREDTTRLTNILRMLLTQPDLLVTMRTKIRPVKAMRQNAEEYVRVYEEMMKL